MRFPLALVRKAKSSKSWIFMPYAKAVSIFYCRLSRDSGIGRILLVVRSALRGGFGPFLL
jgi:hypothetical protein